MSFRRLFLLEYPIVLVISERLDILYSNPVIVLYFLKISIQFFENQAFVLNNPLLSFGAIHYHSEGFLLCFVVHL
jgi:hypothetical protein